MSDSWDVTSMDAVEFLWALSPESIPLIITDPPYQSLEEHRARGTTTRLVREWFEIFPNTRFPELFREVYRVLAKNAHFYLFCDVTTMFVVKPMAEEAGFKFWKPIVWDKCRMGMGYHYRARYEFILFFEKGKRKLQDLGMPDVLVEPRLVNGYPTEKPASLIQKLVQQSSSPGELVVDPFCGSGSTGEAALSLGRMFLGNDLNQKARSLTDARLRKVAGPVGGVVSEGT